MSTLFCQDVSLPAFLVKKLKKEHKMPGQPFSSYLSILQHFLSFFEITVKPSYVCVWRNLTAKSQQTSLLLPDLLTWLSFTTEVRYKTITIFNTNTYYSCFPLFVIRYLVSILQTAYYHYIFKKWWKYFSNLSHQVWVIFDGINSLFSS